jgi:hypothetical protein
VVAVSEPYATLASTDDEAAGVDDAADSDNDKLATARRALAATATATAAAVRQRLTGLSLTDWLVIGLTLGVVAIVGTALAGVTGAGLAVASGLFLAGALAATNSDNPLVTGIGVVSGGIAGVATLATAGLALSLVLQRGFTGLFIGAGLIALVLASLGAFLTPRPTLRAAAILRTNIVLLAGALGAGAVVAVSLLPQAALRAQAAAGTAAVGDAVATAVLSTAPSHALATFFLLVAVALAAVGRLVAAAPIERLLPPDRREPVTATITTLQQRRSTAVRVIFGLGVAVGLGLMIDVAAAGQAGALTRYTALLRTDVLAGVLPAPLGALVGVVTARSIRAVLVLVTLGSLAGLGGLRATRSLRRGLGWTLARGFTPVVAGALTALPVGIAIGQLGIVDRLLAAAPSAMPSALVAFVETAPPVALGAVVAGGVFVAALQPLGVVGGLKTILVVPSRAGSVALGSVGLFGVAVVSVIVGRVGLAVLAAAAGLCVWDLGEFGVGLRDELPAGSPTLRTEAVHAAGSLLVCSVAALGAWLLYQVAVPRLTPPAADIAAVGVLLSLGVAALLAIRVSAP